MKNNKQSPLKERPLHVAGQSSDELIQKYISEDASTLLIIPGMLIVVTVVTWLT